MTPDPLKAIERAGRICYKSENKITENSDRDFVKKLLTNGHYAVLEFADATYSIKHEAFRPQYWQCKGCGEDYTSPPDGPCPKCQSIALKIS